MNKEKKPKEKKNGKILLFVVAVAQCDLISFFFVLRFIFPSSFFFLAFSFFF